MTDAVRAARQALAVRSAQAGWNYQAQARFRSFIRSKESALLRQDGFWFMEMNTRLASRTPLSQK